MRNDVDKPTPEPAVYKAGCRGDKKKKLSQVNSRLELLDLKLLLNQINN